MHSTNFQPSKSCDILPFTVSGSRKAAPIANFQSRLLALFFFSFQDSVALHGGFDCTPCTSCTSNIGVLALSTNKVCDCTGSARSSTVFILTLFSLQLYYAPIQCLRFCVGELTAKELQSQSTIRIGTRLHPPRYHQSNPCPTSCASLYGKL